MSSSTSPVDITSLSLAENSGEITKTSTVVDSQNAPSQLHQVESDKLVSDQSESEEKTAALSEEDASPPAEKIIPTIADSSSSSSPVLTSIPSSPSAANMSAVNITTPLSPPLPGKEPAHDLSSITLRRLQTLINWFIAYSSKSSLRTATRTIRIQQRVNHLFNLDYHTAIISNWNGEFCQSYPIELIILEGERAAPYGHIDLTQIEKSNESTVLKPLFKHSRFSRVHGRFLVPVILIRNKNICRSSTLAIQAEAIFNNVRSSTSAFFGSLYESISSRFSSTNSSASSFTAATRNSVSAGNNNSAVFGMGMEAQRSADEQLLQHLSIKYICDLMVEHKKKKLGVSITSSEKNESHRYGKYHLNAIPYPGCEFFTEYKKAGHCGVDCKFDWSQSFISAGIQLSDQLILPVLSTAQDLHEYDHPAFIHHQQYRKKWQQQLESEKKSVSTSATLTTLSPACIHAQTPVHILNAPVERESESEMKQASDKLTSEKYTQERIEAYTTGPAQEQENETDKASMTAADETTTSTSNGSKTTLPSSCVSDFKDYKDWDLITLTKNYLLVLLAHIADPSSSSGLLVHCISGWDRTPLFVSLLRITLWADGQIHRSLNAAQMLYLTIAYDWMLFGHHLSNRLEKGEDVFYFCFDFLQYITSSKFSLQMALRLRKEKEKLEKRKKRRAEKNNKQAKATSTGVNGSPAMTAVVSTPNSTITTTSGTGMGTGGSTSTEDAADLSMNDLYFTSNKGLNGLQSTSELPRELQEELGTNLVPDAAESDGIKHATANREEEDENNTDPDEETEEEEEETIDPRLIEAVKQRSRENSLRGSGSSSAGRRSRGNSATSHHPEAQSSNQAFANGRSSGSALDDRRFSSFAIIPSKNESLILAAASGAVQANSRTTTTTSSTASPNTAPMSIPVPHGHRARSSLDSLNSSALIAPANVVVGQSFPSTSQAQHSTSAQTHGHGISRNSSWTMLSENNSTTHTPRVPMTGTGSGNVSGTGSVSISPQTHSPPTREHAIPASFLNGTSTSTASSSSSNTLSSSPVLTSSSGTQSIPVPIPSSKENGQKNRVHPHHVVTTSTTSSSPISGSQRSSPPDHENDELFAPGSYTVSSFAHSLAAAAAQAEVEETKSIQTLNSQNKVQHSPPTVSNSSLSTTTSPSLTSADTSFTHVTALSPISPSSLHQDQPSAIMTTTTTITTTTVTTTTTTTISLNDHFAAVADRPSSTLVSDESKLDSEQRQGQSQTSSSSVTAEDDYNSDAENEDDEDDNFSDEEEADAHDGEEDHDMTSCGVDRCVRLTEIRALFLHSYHTILPHTIYSNSNPPHLPFIRRAAKLHEQITNLIQVNDQNNTSQVNTTSTTTTTSTTVSASSTTSTTVSSGPSSVPSGSPRSPSSPDGGSTSQSNASSNNRHSVSGSISPMSASHSPRSALAAEYSLKYEDEEDIDERYIDPEMSNIVNNLIASAGPNQPIHSPSTDLTSPTSSNAGSSTSSLASSSSSSNSTRMPVATPIAPPVATAVPVSQTRTVSAAHNAPSITSPTTTEQKKSGLSSWFSSFSS